MKRDVFDEISDEPGGDIFDEVSGPIVKNETPITRTARAYPSAKAMSQDLQTLEKDNMEGPTTVSYPKTWSLGVAGTDEPITHILKLDADPRAEVEAGRLKPGDVFYQSGIGKMKVGGPTVVTRNLMPADTSIEKPPDSAHYSPDILYRIGQGAERAFDAIASKLNPAYTLGDESLNLPIPPSLPGQVVPVSPALLGDGYSFPLSSTQPFPNRGNSAQPPASAESGSLPLNQGYLPLRRRR